MTFILATGASLSRTPIKEGISMLQLMTRFVKEDEGAALIEYGMLVGLIAVVCVAAVGVLGGTVNGYFTAINGAL
jgi:pilus assembly protein Flp/PilA